MLWKTSPPPTSLIIPLIQLHRVIPVEEQLPDSSRGFFSTSSCFLNIPFASITFLSRGNTFDCMSCQDGIQTFLLPSSVSSHLLFVNFQSVFETQVLLVDEFTVERKLIRIVFTETCINRSFPLELALHNFILLSAIDKRKLLLNCMLSLYVKHHFDTPTFNDTQKSVPNRSP